MQLEAFAVLGMLTAKVSSDFEQQFLSPIGFAAGQWSPP